MFTFYTIRAFKKSIYLNRGVSISIGTFNKISGDTSKWKHLLDSFDCDLRFSDCREIDKYFDWRMFWITPILIDECFDRQIFWFFALKQYLFNLKLKKNWKTVQLMIFKRMNWSNLYMEIQNSSICQKWSRHWRYLFLFVFFLEIVSFS